jgi:hypothetical protein
MPYSGAGQPIKRWALVNIDERERKIHVLGQMVSISIFRIYKLIYIL